MLGNKGGGGGVRGELGTQCGTIVPNKVTSVGHVCVHLYAVQLSEPIIQQSSCPVVDWLDGAQLILHVMSLLHCGCPYRSQHVM